MIIVGNCGFDSRHRAGFDIRRPNGNGFYTLIFIKTEAFLRLTAKSSTRRPIRQSCMIKLLMYTMAAIRRLTVMTGCGSILQRRKIWSKNYRSHWTVHFLWQIPPCWQNTSKSLSPKLSTHLYKEQLMDALMHALLYSLAGQIHASGDERRKNKYFPLFSQIRMNIRNAPTKMGRCLDCPGSQSESDPFSAPL